MTAKQAAERAKQLARKNDKEYFVIYAPEEYEDQEHGYHTTDTEGLDTWYAGYSDRNIVFHTTEGWYS